MPETWPMPGDLEREGSPYPLIDAYTDGMIEEWCLVPVSAVDGPELAEIRATGGRQAAALAFARGWLDYALDLLADDGMHLELTDRVEHHRPIIESADEDGVPWEPCEADHPDAVAFYVLEVVEDA